MKKNRSRLLRVFCVLLCLLMIPRAAWAGIPWTVFVDVAKSKASASGGVVSKDDFLADLATYGSVDVVEGPGGFINYTDDVILALDSGEQLIIKGLTFENGMILGEGTFTLEAVTVEGDASGRAGTIEIVADGDGDLTATVILDEASSVTSTNTQAAIGFAVAGAGKGDVVLTIENKGTIASTTGNGIATIGQMETADITIINSGAIKADNNGIRADATINDPDGRPQNVTIEIVNDGTIVAERNGVIVKAESSLAGANSNATAIVENTGTITAGTGGQGDGIDAKAIANGGEGSVGVDNSGTVSSQSGNGLEVKTQGAAGSDLTLINNGQVSGSTGASVDIRRETDMQVSGNGSFTGATEPENVDLIVRYETNSNDVLTEMGKDALRQDLIDTAEGAGFDEFQAGTITIHAHNDVASNPAYTVEYIASGPPPSTPDDALSPGGGDTFFDRAVANEMARQEEAVAAVMVEEEAPSKYPVFWGVSYSYAKLKQAWLGGASRDLRVFELLEDEEDGAPEKGKRQAFFERLYEGEDHHIELTLRSTPKRDMDLMVAMSMDVLARLVRSWDVTSLVMVNERMDVTDVYPIADIYEALLLMEYGDAREVWLCGMEGDAVIIDRDGNKVVFGE